MRIFSRCLVVVALLAMTVPAWSQTAAVPTASAMTTADSLVAIDRLSKEIAVANPQYPNEKEVPIGVLIRVPNLGGMDAFYKTEPWQLGQMGCFWHIAGFHLFGKRMTPPVAPPPAPVVNAGMVDFAAIMAALLGFWNAIPWWVFLILAIAILATLAYDIYCRRERRRQEQERLAAEERERTRQAEEEARLEEERQMDYRNDPPVVAGGLSEDPNEALRQIQAADALYHASEPGRQVVSATHGEMRSHNGRERVALRVEHTGPNGLQTADRWVNSGDRCTEVTVMLAGSEQPVVEYWLRHCGNRFGEIRDGRFQMPEGWEFVPTSPAVTVEPDPAAEAEYAAQRVEEAATGRHNGRRRNDHFSAQVVITNNGGTNPETKQTIKVTADRYVTQLALPNGAVVTF